MASEVILAAFMFLLTVYSNLWASCLLLCLRLCTAVCVCVDMCMCVCEFKWGGPRCDVSNFGRCISWDWPWYTEGEMQLLIESSPPFPLPSPNSG